MKSKHKEANPNNKPGLKAKEVPSNPAEVD